MITNERQYKITRRQLERLKAAAERFDPKGAAARLGNEALAKAEISGLLSEIEVLRRQILEYDALQDGSMASFEASSLEELPRMLIRARIAQRLSQRALAERLGLKEQQIQRYEADEYEGASLRRLKEIAAALSLRITESGRISVPAPAAGRPVHAAVDWLQFPVRDMYERGWFGGFEGTVAEALESAHILVPEFVAAADRQPTTTFYRKKLRAGKASNRFALLAWECRILQLAKGRAPRKPYSPAALNPKWFTELVAVSRLSDGPQRARSMTEEAGIPLIIEPHLPETYLDGAAILGRDAPVIGMTIRYDRVDNFWFVLIHELMHIARHLRKGKLETVFDDLDAEDESSIEKDADSQAQEVLIPTNLWWTALPRYARTPDSVRLFAAEAGISPAIVAGRVRHEADNYTILKELVGQGEVRRQFPEVTFGT